jgi:hypothetical protein
MLACPSWSRLALTWSRDAPTLAASGTKKKSNDMRELSRLSAEHWVQGRVGYVKRKPNITHVSFALHFEQPRMQARGMN